MDGVCVESCDCVESVFVSCVCFFVTMPSPQERKATAQSPYFLCPPWAGLPSRPYRLDVYQGRLKVDSFDISDDKTFLFGRLQEVVDIQLVHPSLSRVHFAIAHAPAQKAVFITDMGSANKTFVNDMPLAPNEPTKLTLGDAIVPGFDTNRYVLALPEGESEDSPTLPSPQQETDEGTGVTEVLPDFSDAMKALRFRLKGGEDPALQAAVEATGAAITRAKEPTQDFPDETLEAPKPAGWPSKRRFHDVPDDVQLPAGEVPPPPRSKRRFQEDFESAADLPSKGPGGLGPSPPVGEMD